MKKTKQKKMKTITALLIFIEVALVIFLIIIIGKAGYGKLMARLHLDDDGAVTAGFEQQEVTAEGQENPGEGERDPEQDGENGNAADGSGGDEPVSEEQPDLRPWNYEVKVPQSTKDTVVIEPLPKREDGEELIIEEGGIASEFAILVDLDTNEIIVDRGSDVVFSPASMTKIMTILVAADYINDLDEVVTISKESVDYCWENDCSAVGFVEGEQVTVRDLLYGTILPSGADAALELAKYAAGSEEAFVKLMNAKLEELGLSKTAHFTNVVGTYHKDHHCTMKDMAVILSVAIQNDLCREVLSEHNYFTTKTKENPEGLEISNWFLRRIEDKDTNGLVVCGKTGFVDEAGCCAASYEISNSGKNYICVTANTYSSWRCIYDHVALYRNYTK